MKKAATVRMAGGDFDVFTDEYLNNARLAVLLYTSDGEPYCVPSINVVNIFGIEDNEFILNHDIQNSLRENLLKSGIFEDTGKRVSYGFVQNQPVWRLKV